MFGEVAAVFGDAGDAAFGEAEEADVAIIEVEFLDPPTVGAERFIEVPLIRFNEALFFLGADACECVIARREFAWSEVCCAGRDTSLYPRLGEVGPGVGVDVGGVAVVAVGDVDGDAEGGGEVFGGEDLARGAGGDGGASGGEEEDVGGLGEEFFEVVGDGDDGGGRRIMNYEC